ncbi:AraC family transcriptional regulator [Paraburkholderia sp. MMS20-SJTR3]|uniref:AraC family transcriptional regulator n=1 Tax=Paraburkholderia sejongensis TaxID=2886946 RepID=A0ABS8JYH8_9BURK|nr:AraC family transcriptional regulator [Paraburkholderia sp. MMS20-SJTR3]MCC8394753.1 AraC family transcriptional regulator [Paraburkholderia sp. MMS20-SJTR3]
MHAPGATVPISLVNGFLAGVETQPGIVDRHLAGATIPRELLVQPGARVTEEQFSTLYRSLAIELDDEMPGVFARPLRSGTLKFLCLSLLDAPNLETAMHRFGQFFHIVVDDFLFESRRGELVASLTLHPGPTGMRASVLGQELMLKLAHGVASWLIGQRIPLLQVQFAFARPAHALEYLYLFPGPAKFDCGQTSMQFSSSYFDLPVRQRKANLRRFLARAPEDWVFVSFDEQLFSHRVREYVASRLPDVPTIEAAADGLHCSVRTLCRHLAAEGTAFQLLKDELRRDIAIQRLTGTRDAIAVIAGDIGFSDPTAFHRAFRHWTGSTPAAYRRGG